MIRIGPGGLSGLSYEEGLKKIHKLNLNCLEIEFTYGVHMKNDDAIKIGKLAKKLGISLSVHAPYYINLCTEDPEKLVASKKRIMDSVVRAELMGASVVVFHPGFYGNYDKQ